MLKHDLPEVYQGLLPDDFLNLDPQETLATCHNCYRAKPQNPAPHYHPKLKCCTYYPFIPNYLVGGFVDHPVLKQLLQDRRYVLPIGICPPPGYQEMFRNKKALDFGQRDDLQCPFYQLEKGQCGVWQFRGHECSTFFCVSRYEKGESFWLGVREYLSHTEMHLSQNCMLQKGFLWSEIEQNLQWIKRPQDDTRRDWSLSALEWSDLWKHHQDDIEGYFRSCYQFVSEHKQQLKVELQNDRPPTQRDSPRILAAYLLGRSL